MRTNEKKQREGRLQAINNAQLVFMLLQAGTSTFEVVDEELKRKRRVEEMHKKIDAHTALANKVDAIRTLNKQSTEWTVAQTKPMARTCYKRAGNLPLPTTKQLLLTTMTLWCVATLQYQLQQLQWRHFLTLRSLLLHDKIRWESKNERCNDCSEKMRGVFDGTNKIKLKWFHQYKKDAASGCEKNANDKIFSKYPLPIKTFMYDVKIQSMALSHFGRFCHF